MEMWLRSACRHGRLVVLANLVGLAGVAACHQASVGTPTGDGNPGSDGSDRGVVITWSTTPATIPGSAGTDDGDVLTIDSAMFTVETLEIIGDAGDGSDTRTALVLDWGSDGSVPASVHLPSAPPGMYSKLSLHVDGALVGDSYTITGTATIAGIVTPFEIHDQDDLSVTIDVYGTLGPTDTLTLPIAIDLARALRTIDYEELAVTAGKLELTTDDDQMDSFRDQLRDSFYEPYNDGSGSSSDGSVF
jgi:hypothetical protein